MAKKLKLKAKAPVETSVEVERAVVFCCKRCKIALSSPLQRLPFVPDYPEYDSMAPIPPRVASGFYFVEKGDFVVNLSDIRHTLERGDWGCCGRTGQDGRNTLCVNHHEVGTEQSDCWQSHAMIFDGARVSPVPFEAEGQSSFG